MRYRKKQEPEIYNFYEQTFNDAALALFKNSQRMRKDVGGGTELLYMKVPFSDNLWVTEYGLRGVIVEVAVKLHARCWFDLYKPPGAPQLPLDPSRSRPTSKPMTRCGSGQGISLERWRRQTTGFTATRRATPSAI
jgi:hypothetical protein